MPSSRNAFLAGLMVLLTALGAISWAQSEESQQLWDELNGLITLRETNNGESLTASQCIRLGFLRMQLRSEFQEALSDGDLALSKDPDYRDAYLLKAQAYQSLGDYQNSKANYEYYEESVMRAARQRLMENQPTPTPEPVLAYSQMMNAMQSSRWQDVYGKANSLIEVNKNRHPEIYMARARGNRYRTSQPNVSQVLADYTSATLSEEVPLVMLVERAEFEKEYVSLSAAVSTYQQAAARIEQKTGSSDGFPPEWRIRMAQLMKAMEPDCAPLTEDCEFEAECEKAVETIDKLQAQTLPSATLYALRAFALQEMGHTLRARSNAIRAWKLYQKQSTGSEPAPPWPGTCGILHSVLGHHLLFGANYLNAAAQPETTTFCSSGIKDTGWLSYLKDGLAPEGTDWNSDQYAIEFVYGQSGPTHYIGLDLNGHYSVDQVSLQADCNDVYQVQYSDEDAASHTAVTHWHNLYSAGSVGRPGLQTRESAKFTPVRLRWLRIYPVSGDGSYSVSELRAFAWLESQDCE